MSKYKNLKSNIEKIKKSLLLRNYKDINIENLEKMLKEHEDISDQVNKLINNNKILQNIFLEKKENNIDNIKNKLKINKTEIKNMKIKISNYEKNIENIICNIPNILNDDVNTIDKIIVQDNTENIINYKNITLSYEEIIDKTEIIDINLATKISGTKFVCYKNDGYKFFNAMCNFMMKNAIDKGYNPVLLPLIINRESLQNSGVFPRFSNDLYEVKDHGFLIPTSEVSLINLHNNYTFKEEDLPKKYVSLTPCFRKEAGSYGQIAGGLIRVHQFYKVELVIFCTSETSEYYHNILLNDSLEVVKSLKLPYRILLNSASNTSFQSSKTYDIEIYLPSIKRFVEVSSCSNTLDFQSLKTNTKYKHNNKKKYVHILNSSALSVERPLACVLEYYQTDTSVKIPEVLKNFTNFDEIKFKTDKI